MGCGNARENLEDQIMILRLKKMTIQIEKEKNLKLLSDLEGKIINNDNFPEYLASRNGKQINKLNFEQNSNIDINPPPDEGRIGQNVNSSPIIQDNKKEENNDKNSQNDEKIMSPDNIEINNIVDQSISPLTLNSPNKKKKKKKKKSKKSMDENISNFDNLNNCNFDNNINKDINYQNDMN